MDPKPDSTQEIRGSSQKAGPSDSKDCPFLVGPKDLFLLMGT